MRNGTEGSAIDEYPLLGNESSVTWVLSSEASDALLLCENFYVFISTECGLLSEKILLKGEHIQALAIFLGCRISMNSK